MLRYPPRRGAPRRARRPEHGEHDRDESGKVLRCALLRAARGDGRVPSSGRRGDGRLALAAELKSGGKLLVQVFGRNEEHDAANGIVDGLSDAMLDMVNAGRLKRDVYEEFVLPVFYRSLPELLPPTGENGELPAFRVDKAEARECRVPFNEELARSGDPRVWAESYAGFIRAFSEPVVTSGLPNTPDRPQLVEELYDRMVNRFAADPGRYEFHFISLGALLTRV